jgi:restriction system protein
MPIPKAKATMAPILDFLADGREHLDEEIQEEVASYFRLTKNERAMRLKNGIPIYKNRTAWGLVYLQDPMYLPDARAYIERTDVRSGREVYRITRTGMTAQRDRVLQGR